MICLMVSPFKFKMGEWVQITYYVHPNEPYLQLFKHLTVSYSTKQQYLAQESKTSTDVI